MSLTGRKNPKYDIMVFHAMCMVMANLLESAVLPDKKINRQTIKYLSKQLFLELQKPVDSLLLELRVEGIKTGDEDLQDYIIDGTNVASHIHIAAVAMEHFFRLSMQITDLEDVRRNTLFAQMNSLLISYGLEAMDISIFD